MNTAEIEELINAKVAAALAGRPAEKPECHNTQVLYTVARVNECWTKKEALECAFELAKKRHLSVVEFHPWNAEDPPVMTPAVTIRQCLTGSWNNGYDRKTNYQIREWTFANPITPELAKDAEDGIFHINVEEGDEQ